MLQTKATPQDVMRTLAEADNHQELEVSKSEYNDNEIVTVTYATDHSSYAADKIMRQLYTKHGFSLTLSLGHTELFNVYRI